MGVIDYSAAIKLTFDKEITNDPEIILGTEYMASKLLVTDAMLAVSGNYSSREKRYVVDGSLSTRWQTPSGGIPAWIKATFTEAKKLGKIRVYTISGQYPVTAFIIQGSNDNAAWTDVANVTISSSYTGWTTTEFEPIAYQYWRLYVTSGTNSYATIYEIEYWGVQLIYDVAAWSVTGSEYNMQPEGVLANKTYAVKKVTKTPDNLSVILWLVLKNRMLAPQGLVSVSYDKSLGNLVGIGSAQIESFTAQFLPTGITPIFNPNAGTEKIVASANLDAEIIRIYYVNVKEEEYIQASVSLTAQIIAVADIPV